LRSVIAAARAGFLSVLITLGGRACAVDRSVLARNLVAEAVFRLVAREKSRVSPGEVTARYREYHVPPIRREVSSTRHDCAVHWPTRRYQRVCLSSSGA
jgi:hypothetical protein